MFRRLPVVVVLGSTGTGKSKLAIELAKRVGGEIISADSMQVYKGLDIITNKVTSEEMAECPHHMMDFVSPPKEFSVVEYRNMALPLIYDIKKRGKVPIIVGGTNYYIESLMWDMLIDEGAGTSHKVKGNSLQTNASSSESDEESEIQKNIKKRKQIEDRGLKAAFSKNISTVSSLAKSQQTGSDSFNGITENPDKQNTGVSDCARPSSENLYERLMALDPAMAEQLHPNDTRKIARSLQVYQQSGIRHSELIFEQQRKSGGNTLGGPLRFDFTCVFWLRCEREILNERLDKRVDRMLEQGLLKELLEFHAEYNKTCHADGQQRYTEGIFQSIGFKEFHQFLIQLDSSFSLDGSSEKNKELLKNCINAMKVVTRRYAKKQVTWVRNRFLGRPENCAPDVYGLDTTNLDNWEEDVLDKALNILENLIDGCESPVKPLPRISVNHNDRKVKHICQLCDNRIIIGEENWKKHLVSRSHKWHVKRNKRKLEEQ